MRLSPSSKSRGTPGTSAARALDAAPDTLERVDHRVAGDEDARARDVLVTQ